MLVREEADRLGCLRASPALASGALDLVANIRSRLTGQALTSSKRAEEYPSRICECMREAIERYHWVTPRTVVPENCRERPRPTRPIDDAMEYDLPAPKLDLTLRRGCSFLSLAALYGTART